MEKELVAELPAAETVSMNYADKPLRLGGIVEQITCRELCTKVKQNFTYSDSLFGKLPHPPYYNDKINTKKKPKTNPILQKFEQHGFAKLDDLVIGNMQTVGHGVFTNRDYATGECFILYAGVITADDRSNNSDNNDYTHSYGAEVKLSVNADTTGNIARFIQHMPLNFDSMTKFSKKVGDKLPKRDADEYWQWRNLTYKKGLTVNDVAWANMAHIIVPIQNVPCIVFFNIRDLKQGEQLGISYGDGYWVRRDLKPELFDMKGAIIPQVAYGYKEIQVNLPLLEFFHQEAMFNNIGVNKVYDASMLRADLQRPQEYLQPVWFSHTAEPMSIFKLREKLLKYNVIGQEFAAIEASWLTKLRSLLPSSFTVSMYHRNSFNKTQAPVLDVICTTNDLMKWSQLTLLLKNPNFAQLALTNKCLKLTQEVIILNIGNDRSMQDRFLTLLETANTMAFFNMDIPAEYIPTGPTSRDRSGILMATNEEAIQQILFHNPGLTRQEINFYYRQTEMLLGSTTKSPQLQNDQSKEVKFEAQLLATTTTFFKAKVPGTWKTYPKERLTGKYIGHEVRFFNLAPENSADATPFFNKLKGNGFAVELTTANQKPSLVVDLSCSKLT